MVNLGNAMSRICVKMTIKVDHNFSIKHWLNTYIICRVFCFTNDLLLRESVPKLYLILLTEKKIKTTVPILSKV